MKLFILYTLVPFVCFLISFFVSYFTTKWIIKRNKKRNDPYREPVTRKDLNKYTNNKLAETEESESLKDIMLNRIWKKPE